MKKLKLLLNTCLFMGVGFLLHAQTNMNVVLNSGTNPTPQALTGIAKLTFSSGNMNVILKSGTNPAPQALTGIRRVDFGINPTPTCLNTNGDFATGTTNWTVWPGTTTSSTTSGALVITSSSAGAWDILVSSWYDFEAGVEYTIKFDASAPAPKDIAVMIRENYVAVPTLQWGKTITTSLTNHSVTFTYPTPTAVKGEVVLAVGGGTGVTIDNLCIVKGTLSNEEPIALKNNFLMYPNPVKSLLNMNVSEAGHVDIISLDGKVLLSAKVNANETNSINVENLSAGIYLCRYANSKEVKTLKLIKQ